jgi:hypothetical protein
METEAQKSGKKRKTFLVILSGIILAFLVYYTFMMLSAPAEKSEEITAKFGVNKTKDNAQDTRILTDSLYLNLQKEKAFLQSRIAMAETDSIYMTLNIPDSTVNLEISGVMVHSVKFKEIKISKILLTGNRYAISALFSSPLNIVGDLSTIKKEPLMIKMAPKDTSEFKPDIIPDTTDYEPVNYILQMDNGIKIYFYQDTDTTASDRNKLFCFDLNDRLKSTWSSLKSVARLKVPEYHPFIKLKLPKADAKILYRAVPRKGQIAIYI